MSCLIDVENYSYTYPDGTVGLKDVSLSVKHGQRVGLVGPNGSGKTTLLLAMSGFIKGQGRIFLSGIEVCRKNAKQYRRVISSVLQNPDDQLFMPSLIEDVSFGPMNMGLEPEEVRSRSLSALRRVGLEGMENKAGHHLSAGQKRAAAIATVLSMDPAIITMDEPDTSLDPRSRGRLVELLSGLDHTFVIATCNMDFAAEVCGRVILVDGGEVIADGDAKTILSDEKLMFEHGLEVPQKYAPNLRSS